MWRIRGIFGSHQLPTYAGNASDDGNRSDPKRVRYEVFGPPGAVADINYIDADGDPNQVVGAALPWSVEVETNLPGDGGKRCGTRRRRLHRMPDHCGRRR